MKICFNIMSVISVAVLLAGSLYFGYHGKPAEMGLIIVAGALGVALSNLDKFESIKGAGFEVKLREVICDILAVEDRSVEDMTEEILSKVRYLVNDSVSMTDQSYEAELDIDILESPQLCELEVILYDGTTELDFDVLEMSFANY